MADDQTAEIKARLRVEADKGAARKAGKDIADALKEGADSAAKSKGGGASGGRAGGGTNRSPLTGLTSSSLTQQTSMPGGTPGGTRQQPATPSGVRFAPSGPSGVSLSKTGPGGGTGGAGGGGYPSAVSNEGMSAYRQALRSAQAQAQAGGGGGISDPYGLLQQTSAGARPSGARAGRVSTPTQAQRAALAAALAANRGAGGGTPTPPTPIPPGAAGGSPPPIPGGIPGPLPPSPFPSNVGPTPVPLGGGPAGPGRRSRRPTVGPRRSTEYARWLRSRARALSSIAGSRVTPADVERMVDRGDIAPPQFQGGASALGPTSPAQAQRQLDIAESLASRRPMADVIQDRRDREVIDRQRNRASLDRQRTSRNRFSAADAALVERGFGGDFSGGRRGRLSEAQLPEYARRYGLDPNDPRVLEVLRQGGTPLARRRAALETLGGTAPGGTPGQGLPPSIPPAGPTPIDPRNATLSQLRAQWRTDTARQLNISPAEVQRRLEDNRLAYPPPIAPDVTRSTRDLQQLRRINRAQGIPLADLQTQRRELDAQRRRDIRFQGQQQTQAAGAQATLREQSLSGRVGGFGASISNIDAGRILNQHGLPATPENLAAIRAGNSPAQRAIIASRIPGATAPPPTPAAGIGGPLAPQGSINPDVAPRARFGLGQRIAGGVSAGISGIGSLALLVNAAMMYRTLTQGAETQRSQALEDYGTGDTRLIRAAQQIKVGTNKDLLDNARAVTEEEHNYQQSVKEFNKTRIGMERAYFDEVEQRQKQRKATILDYNRTTADLARNRTDLEKNFSRSYEDQVIARKKIDTDYSRARDDLSRNRANVERDFSRQYEDLARQRQATELSYQRTVQDIARDKQNLERDYFRQVEDTQRGRIKLELDYNRQVADLAKARVDIDQQNARTQRDLAKQRLREQQDFSKDSKRQAEDEIDQRRLRAADDAEHLKNIKEQQKASAAAQFAALGSLVNAAEGGDPFAIISALLRLQELNTQKQQIAADAARGGYSAADAVSRDIADRNNARNREDLATGHARSTEDLATAQADANENYAKAIADLDLAIQRNNEDYKTGLDEIDRTVLRNSQDYQTGLDAIGIATARNNEDNQIAIQNLNIAEGRLDQDRATALEGLAVAEGRLAADRITSLADLDLQWARTVQDFNLGIQEIAIAQFRANENLAINLHAIDDAQHKSQQAYIDNVKTISDAEAESSRTHLLNMDALARRQGEIYLAEQQAMEQLSQQRFDLDKQLARSMTAADLAIEQARNQMIFAFSLNAVFAGQMVMAFKTMWMYATASAAASAVGAGAAGAGAAGAGAGAAGGAGLLFGSVAASAIAAAGAGLIAGGLGYEFIRTNPTIQSVLPPGVADADVFGSLVSAVNEGRLTPANLYNALTQQGATPDQAQALTNKVQQGAAVQQGNGYDPGKYTGTTGNPEVAFAIEQANQTVAQVNAGANFTPSSTTQGIYEVTPNKPHIDMGKDVYTYNPVTGKLSEPVHEVTPGSTPNPRPWDDKQGTSSVAEWARVLNQETDQAAISAAEINTKLSDANDVAALVPPSFKDTSEYAALVAERFNEAAKAAKEIQDKFGAITVTVAVRGGGTLTFDETGKVVGGAGTNTVSGAPGETPGVLNNTVGGDTVDPYAGMGVGPYIRNPRPKRRLGDHPAYIDPATGQEVDDPRVWGPGSASHLKAEPVPYDAPNLPPDMTYDEYVAGGFKSASGLAHPGGGPNVAGTLQMPNEANYSPPVNSVGVRSIANPTYDMSKYTAPGGLAAQMKLSPRLNTDVNKWYKEHPELRGQSLSDSQKAHDEWFKAHPTAQAIMNKNGQGLTSDPTGLLAAGGGATPGAGPSGPGAGIHVYDPNAIRTSPPPNPPPPAPRPGTGTTSFSGPHGDNIGIQPGLAGTSSGWASGSPVLADAVTGNDPISALVPRLDALITILQTGEPIVVPGGSMRQQLHSYLVGDRVV